MGIKFNSTKYKHVHSKIAREGDPQTWTHEHIKDYSDGYANNAEMVASFYHVPSGETIYFKAFIAAFNETYSTDWGRDAIYGRTDPVYLYKNTQRKISLALKVPAGTASEAFENLGKVQKLTQFLYPSYVQSDSTTTIGQSPLVRIKMTNLLASQGGNLTAIAHRVVTKDKTTHEMYDDYISTSSPESGLLGAITSLAVNHNLENNAIGVIEKAPNTILPKMIEINLEFSPIHEQPLGWDEDGHPSSPLFPYAVDLTDKVPGPPKPPVAPPNAIVQEAVAQVAPPPRPELPDDPPPKPPNQALQDGARAQLNKLRVGGQVNTNLAGDTNKDGFVSPWEASQANIGQGLQLGVVSKGALMNALDAELARIDALVYDPGMEED